MQHGLISMHANKIKVIATGKIEKAINVRGIGVTAAAQTAIKAVGGTVE